MSYTNMRKRIQRKETRDSRMAIMPYLMVIKKNLDKIIDHSLLSRPISIYSVYSVTIQLNEIIPLSHQSTIGWAGFIYGQKNQSWFSKRKDDYERCWRLAIRGADFRSKMDGSGTRKLNFKIWNHDEFDGYNILILQYSPLLISLYLMLKLIRLSCVVFHYPSNNSLSNF